MICRMFTVCLFLAGSLVAAPRPNVVVVLCDDLGYGDLACFGNPVVKTPHLDRFARGGLKLTSCYAAAANCSPARAGLLTGRTPYRAGIHNWIPMFSPMHLRRGEITLSRLLQQSGYTTCHVGKWHLNGRFNLDDQPQPSDHGFDYWFSTQNNALPSHRDPDNFVRNGKPAGPLEGYSSQLVVDEARRWISSVRDKSKPFFLFTCFHEPHEPIASAEIFERPYAALDNPSQIRHHGNITQMDHAFGRLLATLEEHKLDENTLVIFTSDNGPAITRYHPHGSTGPLRQKKGHLYEGGIRVPGIIHWPGHTQPGTTSDTPVSGVDLLPTICAAAGVALPENRKLDGTNILPLLAGQPLLRRQPLYWQFHVASSKPKVALRDGDWKLLAHLQGPQLGPFGGIRPEDQHAIKTQTIGKLELYNLKTDIGETRDLVSSQPARLARMATVLKRLFTEVQDESPTWPAWKWPGHEGKRIAWAGRFRGNGWRSNGGSHPDARVPTHWSATNNIAWATPLPTRSNSLPVFSRGAVFTCIEPFGLAKLSLADGKILWKRTSSYTDITSPGDWTAIRKEVDRLKQLTDARAALAKQREKLEDSLDKAKDQKAVLAAIEKIESQEEKLGEQIAAMPRAARYSLPITQRQYNGYTTATPVTDGRLVWAVFGNRVVTCFDVDGNRQWARVLPDNPQSMWGHSASPLLVAGRLIVPIEDIVALDPETGKELWRTGYGQTWGSPVRAEINGRPLILMANGRMVRPRDGKIIGRMSPLERSSPVVVGNTAFYIGQRAEAFPLPDRLDPKATKRLRPKPLWEASPPGGGFSASPIVHDGLIYCVATRGILTVLETNTGKTVYTRRLNLGNGPAWPSVLHAGQHVYVSNRDGNTVVFRTGRTYQEVARNKLEEFISTPVVHRDRIYIRTYRHLYAIGK
ncbi:MAG: sulfatase-like hydrolase/transferase [Planctomycetaceae bacterium]|jgi:arylsulfatase A|nr:sulfatase-like hydrolase/transferase [Planctomycetaceae bacterium]